MVKLKERSILHANIFYLFTGILFIIFGSIAQSREIYSGLLITEYILILLPSILYIKIKGLSIKKTLKLNRISPKQILYVIGITIFTYPIAIFFNLIVITVLSLFGELNQGMVPIADSAPLFLFSVFVIAITPAICEEVMFRGVIMNAYENISKRKAIIYSAILFGIFHINIQNLVGPVLLGLIFGITVYKTNSIYAGMIGHGINNGIAITIGYFANKAMEMLPETSGLDMPMDGSDILIDGVDISLDLLFQVQLVIGIIVIGALALFSYKILKRLIKGMPLGEGGEFVSLRKSDKLDHIMENDLVNETDDADGAGEIKLFEDKAYKFNIFHYLPIAVFFIFFIYINVKATYM